MAWIKIDTKLLADERVAKLAEDLGVPFPHAVGMLACLWLHAAQKQGEAGRLKTDREGLALACRYPDPERLEAALERAGLLRREGDGYVLELFERWGRRAHNERERQRRHRDQMSRDMSRDMKRDIPQHTKQQVDDVSRDMSRYVSRDNTKQQVNSYEFTENNTRNGYRIKKEEEKEKERRGILYDNPFRKKDNVRIYPNTLERTTPPSNNPPPPSDSDYTDHCLSAYLRESKEREEKRKPLVAALARHWGELWVTGTNLSWLEEWVEKGASIPQLNYALQESARRGVRSRRYVDAILRRLVTDREEVVEIYDQRGEEVIDWVTRREWPERCRGLDADYFVATGRWRVKPSPGNGPEASSGTPGDEIGGRCEENILDDGVRASERLSARLRGYPQDRRG